MSKFEALLLIQTSIQTLYIIAIHWRLRGSR